MHSGTAPDYLLAVSVSTLGDCVVEGRLTPVDVLHFAMTVERTWRLVHLSPSIRVPVAEQGKERIHVVRVPCLTVTLVWRDTRRYTSPDG